MKRTSIATSIACALVLFCATAFGQRGAGTPVANGPAFPASAVVNTLFLNTSVPGLFYCTNSPTCTSSGQWGNLGGAGGTCSSSCANLTLSNLAGTTAIPVALISATNTNLLLAGAVGTASFSPGTASLVGGAAFSGSSQTGASAFVTGGAGGTSGGGQVFIESGAAVSGSPSGAVSVFTANGVGAGAAGNLLLFAGNGGTTGAGGSIFGQAGHMGTIGATNNGYFSLAGGGAVYTTCTPLSGFECAFMFLAGASGSGPGEIDLTGGGSSAGVVRLTNMSLAFSADATYPLNLTTLRPTHAYFAGNVYATSTGAGLTGAFSSLAAGATLSTQNAANWHAEGQYGGTCVSQTSTMVAMFAANGILQTCFNGGSPQNVAYTTSTTTGTAAVAFPGNCSSTGTTAWKLAKLSTSAGTPCFVISATTDVTGIVGIVVAGAGTSGNPTIAHNGEAQLLLDGSPTANDYVIPSTSSAGEGHDAGSSCPTGAQIFGRVVNTTADGNGAYTVLLGSEGCGGINGPGIMLSSSAPLTASPVAFSGSGSTALLWGFYVWVPTTTTTAHYYVSAADSGSCTYDIGILNASGNIVAHTGNQTAAALGMNVGSAFHQFSWATPATIQPGKYYLAITANLTSGCATLGYTSNMTFAGGVSETVSSGGTLNGGMTIPGDGWATSSTPAFTAN